MRDVACFVGMYHIIQEIRVLVGSTALNRGRESNSVASGESVIRDSEVMTLGVLLAHTNINSGLEIFEFD